MSKLAEITYSSFVCATFAALVVTLGVMALHTLAVAGRLAEAVLRAVGVY